MWPRRPLCGIILTGLVQVIGLKRTIAGVDCGFGTFVGSAPPIVADSIVWAKLQALADGAQIASGKLWE